MDDVLNDALLNLEHDNYECSDEGHENRQADVALIRTALAAHKPDGGEVEVVLRQFLTEDGFIAECDIPHIVAALAAQPAASAEPEQYKTDDELGGVLAAIRYYGGQKWAEGRGVADADLKNVRDAWYAVYERVQALTRYSRPAGDAQPVAAQETYPQMMPAELSQFLSDVMTASGLVSHGKQCKALGERLGDACMRLRLHYPEPFAAPVAAQEADDSDPLQGAANWLVNALANPRPIEIAARLLIGYNRAERLFDAAIAQQRKGE